MPNAQLTNSKLPIPIPIPKSQPNRSWFQIYYDILALAGPVAFETCRCRYRRHVYVVAVAARKILAY
jgi:hypothetical protein